MTLAEIAEVVEQFRRAAVNAKEAGFDGVELHGANGYLLDQFLRDGANHRTDSYGGSIQNRARFPLEVTDAVIGVWGASRVGYKISPYFSNLGMSDSSPIDTFSYLAKELGSREIAYLHIAEAVAGTGARSGWNGACDADPASPLRRAGDRQRRIQPRVRERGDRGRTRSTSSRLACRSWRTRTCPERWRRGAPLNAPQFDLFYTGEEKGYIDYPTLEQQVTA